MQLLSGIKQALRQSAAVVLVSLVILSSFFLVQPSYAANTPSFSKPLDPSSMPENPSYSPLTPEEKVDRAYDLRVGVGMEEELRQKKLREGQSLENVPAPYKRVTGAEGKEVPDTSLLETTVGKIKELVE